MKIVKAMKVVARLQGDIKDLKHRISNSLNTVVGNKFDEDYKVLTGILDTKIERVIDLKSKIMASNIKNDIFKVILTLGEAKSRIDFLRELNPKNGVEVDRYSENNNVYTSQITVKEKIELVEAFQKEINEITDNLDDFNAQADI